ncbi:MAG: 4-hydroxythreonine-4-phosphate dehydrogenase PdxA [Pseudohongiellaceae bacterium]
MPNRIAITPGEPAGIGPDLCIELAQNPIRNSQCVVVADPALLAERSALLGRTLVLTPFDPDATPRLNKPNELFIVPVSQMTATVAGQLDPSNSEYVLNTLRTASDLVLDKTLDALVTGPVHKGNINDGGFSFSGHTEFLADHCNVNLTVMMLATEGLRVALATTHLPLSQVPRAITQPLLNDIVTILNHDLKLKFGIANPSILVCGLNPHAGENGHLGTEELEVIGPALDLLRAKGINLMGPLPADTLFTPKYLDHADAVLAMYHDQGLPVLKFKGFGDSCNITLGLPMVRTSVDHGTAIDLAGTGEAENGSLYNAINTAVTMAEHWKNT